MIKRVVIIAISVIAIFTVTACSNNFISSIFVKEEHEITNVKIYKDTPAWELAQAVEAQNTSEIERIIKDQPQVLNYQDSKYGATLLMWAVGMEKYQSAKTLLKCGADPDIATTKYGKTPLFLASEFSWVDNEGKTDPRYVKLLLRYNADPNKNYIGYIESGSRSTIEPGTSPLMNSIGSGIEKTKALVEAGADINYKNEFGTTAAIRALLNYRDPQYAYYLIFEKKASVTDPHYRSIILPNADPNRKFFPVTKLRKWVFDLDSQEHKMKMEIVEEFARQGVNYWDTKIYNDTIEQIKKLYPDTWEEYIKKY